MITLKWISLFLVQDLCSNTRQFDEVLGLQHKNVLVMHSFPSPPPWDQMTCGRVDQKTCRMLLSRPTPPAPTSGGGRVLVKKCILCAFCSKSFLHLAGHLINTEGIVGRGYPISPFSWYSLLLSPCCFSPHPLSIFSRPVPFTLSCSHSTVLAWVARQPLSGKQDLGWHFFLKL